MKDGRIEGLSNVDGTRVGFTGTLFSPQRFSGNYSSGITVSQDARFITQKFGIYRGQVHCGAVVHTTSDIYSLQEKLPQQEEGYAYSSIIDVDLICCLMRVNIAQDWNGKNVDSV